MISLAVNLKLIQHCKSISINNNKKLKNQVTNEISSDIWENKVEKVECKL